MKAIVRIALCATLFAATCGELSYAQSSTRRAPSSQNSTSSQVQRQSQSSSQKDATRKASPSQERKKEATRPSSNHGSSAKPGHNDQHGKPGHNDQHNRPGHQPGHNDQHNRPGHQPGHNNPGHHVDNRPSHNHNSPAGRPHYINGHKPAPFHVHSHSNHHYYGYYVRTLPAGYHHHIFHGIDYYLCDGIYYRMHNGAYVVCRPPYGYTFASYSGSPYVVYVNVPGSYGTVNRVKYYYDDGVFFYMNPRGQYEVVQAPLGALVESIPEDCELVRINGEDYYLVDYTLYKLVVVQGKPMFEVIDNNAYNLR